MLFIIAILIVAIIVLLSKMSNSEINYLGKTSSLKLKLKEKDNEIIKLKNQIIQLKCNTDVEV